MSKEWINLVLVDKEGTARDWFAFISKGKHKVFLGQTLVTWERQK